MAGLISDFGGPLPLEESARAARRRLRRAAALDHRPAALGQGRAGDLRAPDRALRRPPADAEELLADDPEAMRAAAGLSRAKVAALRSLAEHVLAGELQLDALAELPDEEVMRELVAVKGIGEWTAHMFLMFTLHRPRRAADRRPGHQERRHARLRPRRGAQAGRDDRDRRAVAPVPHARLRVPLALARTTRLPEPRLFEVEVALDQPLDRPGGPCPRCAARAPRRARTGSGRGARRRSASAAPPATSGAFSPPITATHWRKRAR